MSNQKRFFEYKSDDDTLSYNRVNVGVMEPGRYRGFGMEQNAAGMTLRLGHSSTGAYWTDTDKSVVGPYGVLITKSGLVMHELEVVTIGINPTFGSKRTDIIVVEHEYLLTPGGAQASYEVIEGPEGGAVPQPSKSNTQVIIGTLYLPANCSNLQDPGVSFVPAAVPGVANNSDYVKRIGGQLLGDLDANAKKVKNLKNAEASTDAVNLKQVQDLLKELVPAGMIMMWSGSVESIPKGWILCNGANGTPNLADKFVVGSGTEKPGTTGGTKNMKLTTDQIPSHSHSCDTKGSHSHSISVSSGGAHSHSASTGSGGAHNHGYKDSYFCEKSTSLVSKSGTIDLGSAKYGGSGDSDNDNRYTYYRTASTEHTASHTHSVTVNSGGSHSHSASSGNAGDHTHTIGNTGGGNSFDNRPPFYTIAFIMKT